ncbi:antibiotic biosynthesis monooxygenase [Arthrobacter sp. CAN_C5]|uniref:antibiotic biosynthesis monooxygenase family protein n=1 Tax=Arthrobacter sp. CAN_C5 TaxID=2760706 RepID=UPI001AE2A3F8|nr:antibiotic biosynthesis monooxygenase family protein [Arthrobacter sp. CAN_C5]MBP2217623.1 heme-degrading monooxygenase HmoA [Arthrobacter sp. CAN_C5]
MVYEHAQLTIRPDGHEEFRATYPAIRENLLAVQGCRSVDLHPSVDQPDIYLLRVGWDSLSDHTEVFPDTEQGRTVLALLQVHVTSVGMIHFDADTVDPH